MCLDHRLVNQHLATDIYPIPRLEELVEQAVGHRYYVTLDMRKAYFQVLLDEESRDVTIHSDRVTLYRFRRLPFGINCSPAIFSRQMALILGSLLKKGLVKNYLDDVILWAPTFTELIDCLTQLFQVLEDHGVKLNLKLSKCKFGLSEVTFLGHRVSQKGSMPAPINVDTVLQMKPPTNVKDVRRFLGMCGFHHKCIPSFAKITLPLTNLTRIRTVYKWSEECQKAFEELKQHLTKALVLVKADLNRPIILPTT